MARKKIPPDIKRQVLHDSGYRCGNPICRTIITLDIHHIVQVSEEGKDNPNNLLALCPNCHSLFHKKIITLESVRAWKMILVSLNNAMDKKTLELLLTLSSFKDELYISGDGILQCSPLIAGHYVDARRKSFATTTAGISVTYSVKINERGKRLLDAWKNGDQEKVVQALEAPTKD